MFHQKSFIPLLKESTVADPFKNLINLIIFVVLATKHYELLHILQGEILDCLQIH